MKRSKIWKITWIAGIYIILIIILYLVIQYKVEWEHKDFNTYLYFYDCNKYLCTSTTKTKDYYSKVICENNICPYVTNIIENNVILEKENQSWLYDYEKGEIVSNNYTNYSHLSDNMIIVTNETNNQGIIDLLGNILIEPKYEYIENYYNGILLYKENNIYKIQNNEQIYELDENFTDIILINDTIFAGAQNNLYKIYSYNNINNENNTTTYDYIYAYNDIILTINNKKIDIITTNLNSTMLMKIDTFYEYKTEKERGSLNIYTDGDIIFFDVFKNELEYTTYKYSISNKKLV